MSRRRNSSKRPYTPGAGQDAGRRRQQDPGTAAEHSFRGRKAGGKLHKRGEKTKRNLTPTPKAATPKPRAKAPTPDDVAAFSAAAARRGAPAPSAQRDRLIELGIIKEVVNV